MDWLRPMRIERGLKIPNIFNNLILKKSCHNFSSKSGYVYTSICMYTYIVMLSALIVSQIITLQI